MHDRTELDLRFEEHKRLTQAINGQSWKYSVTLPMPATRKTLATLLRALAARLDPTTAAPVTEIAPPDPATP
jgi:hypothetical protein